MLLVSLAIWLYQSSQLFLPLLVLFCVHVAVFAINVHVVHAAVVVNAIGSQSKKQGKSRRPADGRGPNEEANLFGGGIFELFRQVGEGQPQDRSEGCDGEAREAHGRENK